MNPNQQNWERLLMQLLAAFIRTYLHFVIMSVFIIMLVFLIVLLACYYLCRLDQETGEDPPSENPQMDYFSQERGDYISAVGRRVTRALRRNRLHQFLCHFFLERYNPFSHLQRGEISLRHFESMSAMNQQLEEGQEEAAALVMSPGETSFCLASDEVLSPNELPADNTELEDIDREHNEEIPQDQPPNSIEQESLSPSASV